MTLLEIVSPHKTAELNTEVLDQTEINIDKKTRKQIEKIGARVLRQAEKGHTNISAAPNWLKAWRQDTELEPKTVALVQEVLAINGLAAEIIRVPHGDMVAEHRVNILSDPQAIPQQALEQADDTTHHIAA